METLELLGINPLLMFAFPLVVLVGYTVVLIQAHKAAKAASKLKADRAKSAKAAADVLARATDWDFTNDRFDA